MTSRLLVVPVGSWEQHGPHLPFDTDTRIASELSRRLIEASSSWTAIDAELGPAVTVTASGEHAGFPGTLSIGTDTTAAVLIEIARSATWSERIVFVNGHGGNAEAMHRAAQILQSEDRRVLFWSPPTEDDCDTHAGHIETSVILAIAPGEVRHDLAEAGVCEPLAALLPRLRRLGLLAVSPNGILGDPRRADADTGRQLLAKWSAALASAVRTWCAAT